MKTISKSDLTEYLTSKDVVSVIIHEEREMITPRLYKKGLRQKYTTIEVVFREKIIEEEDLMFRVEQLGKGK